MTSTAPESAKFTTLTGADWRRNLIDARTRRAHQTIHIELIRRNVAELKKTQKESAK